MGGSKYMLLDSRQVAEEHLRRLEVAPVSLERGAIAVRLAPQDARPGRSAVHSYTDCRTEDGVTVGLIDALGTIVRVLATRDLESEAAREALADLGSDEDLRRVLVAAASQIQA